MTYEISNDFLKITNKIQAKINDDIENFIVSTVQESALEEDFEIEVNALKIAYAIRKDTPIGVVKAEPYKYLGCYCPMCDEEISDEIGEPKYCYECGQALDWSNVKWEDEE